MSDLKKTIQKKILEPYNNNIFDTILAKVTAYDNLKNRATITFNDPKNTGAITLENVPVQLGSGGFHSAGPFPGDQVWVTFANKSLLQPKIVSLADERYQINTRNKLQHKKQGSYLTDRISNINDYNNNNDFSDINPMYKKWLDIGNTDTGKYMDYNSEPIAELINSMMNVSYYDTAEPGITHPNNSSTIKIRNNGVIDIFVATNQGIRIDPSNSTINIYGLKENHNVNELDITADEKIKVETKGSMCVNSDTSLLKTKESKVETSLWKVNSTGDISVTSDKNIILEAKENITIKSANILINGNVIKK
jgi:hypothetical protein